MTRELGFEVVAEIVFAAIVFAAHEQGRRASFLSS
jgi:hypothetical protein